MNNGCFGDGCGVVTILVGEDPLPLKHRLCGNLMLPQFKIKGKIIINTIWIEVGVIVSTYKDFV